MKLTFLGTGTSFGVPVVGCDCDTCHSSDPRDRRTRHSALLAWDDGTRVLVDTPPELRLQLLDAGVDHVDAVWYTHLHADHLHGIDDLRIFSMRERRTLPLFTSSDSAAVLRRRFDYIFDSTVIPPEGTSKPQLELRPLARGVETRVAGRAFLPLSVPHGDFEVFGFRVGDLGYITDAKSLPPETMAGLVGVSVLVLNALWWGSPHPTHFNVEEALAAAEAVGAERTYLVHLTHRVRHAELERALPSGVFAAHDGLTVTIQEDPSP